MTFDYERGQWAGFDRVLGWLNEQEDLTLRKTDVYAAVMELRPTQCPSPSKEATMARTSKRAITAASIATVLGAVALVITALNPIVLKWMGNGHQSLPDEACPAPGADPSKK